MSDKQRPYVIVSGGFDPIHEGHIRMIKEASKIGDVIVILNNDNWLMSKKDYCFMNERERMYIVENITGVWMTFLTKHNKNDKDRSVVKTLKEIKKMLGPTECMIFANGGDRIATNTLEIDYCMKNDIKIMFNVGGGKVQSSSDLVKNAKNNIR